MSDRHARPCAAAGREHWPQDRRAPPSAVRCSSRCVCVHGHCGCARNLLEGRDQIRPRVRLEVASIADLGAEKEIEWQRAEKRTAAAETEQRSMSVLRQSDSDAPRKRRAVLQRCRRALIVLSVPGYVARSLQVGQMAQQRTVRPLLPVHGRVVLLRILSLCALVEAVRTQSRGDRAAVGRKRCSRQRKNNNKQKHIRRKSQRQLN